ncbi:MAG: 4-hydroxy-tetrahydrodipicolinate reductase [Eubacteriales bacterium]|nr:4-hydroxy-tetrahydrodipicolinate reductase [Eubacteriales bacterium]
MINIAVVGSGRMGTLVRERLDQTEGVVCAGVVDQQNTACAASLFEIKGAIDVIIDFSHPENLQMITEYVTKNPTPLVVATTGYSEAQTAAVKSLGATMPVVFTANFSLGITVMAKVLREVGAALGDSFDIEIIEKHHNQKIDAPSGTAKLLADAIDPEHHYPRVCARDGIGKRGREIGIQAIRAGNMSGEHTVIFAAEDEILEFTHKAGSRQIFAIGAVKAACFAVEQAAGLYSMENVLFG